MGEVEDTALEGGSTEGDPTEGDLEGAVLAFVIVVFGTLMGAFSTLDIRTSTRFIIPIITRILSTGLIRDTKCVRASRLHAESGKMKMGVGFC